MMMMIKTMKEIWAEDVHSWIDKFSFSIVVVFVFLFVPWVYLVGYMEKIILKVRGVKSGNTAFNNGR